MSHHSPMSCTPLFNAAKPRGHRIHQRGACWITARCWDSGLCNKSCAWAFRPASCGPGPKPLEMATGTPKTSAITMRMDACPSGGCSVGESTVLCKARGICWGCVWHLDLGGCRCPLVVLGSKTRHRGELLPATQRSPATPRAALLWDEKGEGRWTAQWDSNRIFQRR